MSWRSTLFLELDLGCAAVHIRGAHRVLELAVDGSPSLSTRTQPMVGVVPLSFWKLFTPSQILSRKAKHVANLQYDCEQAADSLARLKSHTCAS